MAAKATKTATLDDLLVQARITNRLIAAQLKERMKQRDLIRLLMSTDASDQDLADILDTSKGTIANEKTEIRKAAKRPSKGSP